MRRPICQIRVTSTRPCLKHGTTLIVHQLSVGIRRKIGAIRFALVIRVTEAKNPILTVHGANRLAAVGLAALPAAPAMRRGEVVLLNISSESRGRRDTHTSWPIWRRSCSLAAIQALIAHPQMVVARPDEARLHALGVIEVRRARRIEKVVAAGIYVNFTRAEAL